MKYNNLQKCIVIAENICSLSGHRIADANVSIVSFQKGANAKMEQRLCFTLEYDDADISIEITPKMKGGE